MYNATAGEVPQFPRTTSPVSFTYCNRRIHRGKLFNAVVDLEFTYLFMQRDVCSSAGVWNHLFSPDKPQVESVLADFRKFSGKVDILYNLTAFSFRCRAFWDKYMGILVLLYDEAHYEKLLRANSRKKAFRNIAGHWNEFSLPIQKCLGKVLYDRRVNSDQDDRVTEILKDAVVLFPHPFLDMFFLLLRELDAIRTAEAHGAGMLRKWSLSMLPLERTRDFGLINHWNLANSFVKALRETVLAFAVAPRQQG